MKRTYDYSNSGNKKENSLRNDYINYISVPTLKSLASVRVVTALSISPNVRNDALDEARRRKFPFPFPMYIGLSYYNAFNTYPDKEKIFAEIDKIISILPLPTVLKTDLASIARPIEFQRLKWMRFFNCTECKDSLHWTNDGTIDIKKIVEECINSNSRHCMPKIFKLACNHCMETCIPKIWDKLTEAEKYNYLYAKDLYSRYDYHLLAFWIHFIEGDLSELLLKIRQHDPDRRYNANQSLYQNLFNLALSFPYSTSNIMALRYFWGKFTDAEKCSNLAQFVKSTLKSVQLYLRPLQCEVDGYQEPNDSCDLLYFLLSQMTDGKQQREVFQKNSFLILNSLFISWPWQRFLLPTLQVMWDYLDEKVFVDFMSLVASHIKEGYGTEKILKEIWCASPTSFRICFIQYILHSGRTNLWCNLLLVKDIGTILMILKDVGMDERKGVIYSLIKNQTLLRVIYTDKLDLFDILVQNTLTLKVDVLDLKKSVAKKLGRYLCHQWIIDDNLGSVEKFLSWAFTSQNEINEFKNEFIDKTKIVHTLVCYPPKFELADKFLNWCYNSQTEVNEFKKNFALSSCDIVEICEDDFHTLEKLVHWGFVYDKDVNEFKLRALQNFHLMETLILNRQNFEFADKLINWCCHSEEEMKEYKGKFALSETFMEILQYFVTSSFIHDDDDICHLAYTRKEILQRFIIKTCVDDKDELYDFEGLTKKLITLFSPLEKRVIVRLKEKIKDDIFDDTGFEGCIMSLINEKDLFCMIDNVNNIRDKNSVTA